MIEITARQARALCRGPLARTSGGSRWRVREPDADERAKWSLEPGDLMVEPTYADQYVADLWILPLDGGYLLTPDE